MKSGQLTKIDFAMGRFARSAFTLPELLITILLISILFTLALLFTNSMGQTRKIRDYSIAVSLAQQAVEIMRSAPFGLLDDEDAGKDSVEADLNTDSGSDDFLKPEFAAGNNKYVRHVNVTNAVAQEDENRAVGLKIVNVKVFWKGEGDEKSEPFEITTTIADLN